MRLFISYAHVDKPIVQDWIVSKLVAGGHDVWFDARLIDGQGWKQQLSDAIERSDALVYCITPESIDSEWCQWELAKAVELEKPAIPVLMQARTNIPETLSELQYVDFSDGPTGDAVARLMGGLQQLAPAQIPPAPADPKGKPAQAIEQEENTGQNMVMKILRDPIWQFVGVVIAVITIIIGIVTSGGSGSSNQSVSQPTPSTPRITAQENMDIWNGPGTNFDRIAVLNAGNHLDILGISDDDRWYQVLLPAGNTGWVVAASSAGKISGPLVALAMIIPTNTPTSTPTLTSTVTSSFLQTPTNAPTSIVSSITYPCHAVVDPSLTSTRLNVVKQFPNSTSTTVASVRRGDTVIILERSEGTDGYYHIQSGGRTLGWIAASYLQLSASCP